jgi:RNA polymerase sigma factor (sigma-70 family)
VTKKVLPGHVPEIEECFKSMSGSVYGYLRWLARGDRDLCEDLVQETFREAAQSWDELRGLTEEARLAWLKRVAFNTATDLFRHEQTRREKWPLICERHTLPDTDIHQQVITSMAVRRFAEVIGMMPPVRRRVAFLFWRCGWRNHEIAEELCITASGVTQHLDAARQTLERELRPYAPSDPSEPEGDD